MTEDVENVFEGRPQPYLKSTECSYEEQKEWTLESRPMLPVRMNGRPIERETAMLTSLGIISRAADGAYYEEPALPDEAAAWMRQALTLVGKDSQVAFPAGTGLNSKPGRGHDPGLSMGRQGKELDAPFGGRVHPPGFPARPA
jgi:hypothetical protein